ncbi:MAG: hypothetical protein Q9N34_00425 [Aquificota bacterium]|nr:hypothetical protein [Aquificota bacterium]
MKTISAGEIQFAYARRYFQEFVSSRPGVAEVLKKVKTPALVVDLEGVRSKYVQIRYHLPEVNVYYAVKANDHIDILRALADMGSGFEVASIAELEKVLSLGVPPERVISSNPVKPEEFIDFAYRSGVRRFAVDSFAEVEKISRVAPQVQGLRQDKRAERGK